jgi:hypothetical protein
MDPLLLSRIPFAEAHVPFPDDGLLPSWASRQVRAVDLSHKGQDVDAPMDGL